MSYVLWNWYQSFYTKYISILYFNKNVRRISFESFYIIICISNYHNNTIKYYAEDCSDGDLVPSTIFQILFIWYWRSFDIVWLKRIILSSIKIIGDLLSRFLSYCIIFVNAKFLYRKKDSEKREHIDVCYLLDFVMKIPTKKVRKERKPIKV